MFSFRRWLRLICMATVASLFIYFYVDHLPAAPQWQNSDRAKPPTPTRVTQEHPDFNYQSRLRKHPNFELESRLNDALLKIEIASSMRRDGPVRRIWQTASQSSENSRRWQELNVGWAYEFVSDDDADNLIVSDFSTIPSLSSLWARYPLPVLRADLLRYLLLWYYGGYYADIDVLPRMPIESCAPFASIFTDNQTSTISLVLGIEIDEPYVSSQTKKLWHWSRTYGFIQYNLYAPRRFSPVLRRVLVRALAHSIMHNERNKHWYRALQYREEDILEVTGPGMFTDAVLDVLSESLPAEHTLFSASGEGQYIIDDDGHSSALGVPYSDRVRKVTWAPFHKLERTLWIQEDLPSIPSEGHGGLVVLPVSVWGNGQRHSGAEDFNSPNACINHEFGRSWKKGWWEYIVG